MEAILTMASDPSISTSTSGVYLDTQHQLDLALVLHRLEQGSENQLDILLAGHRHFALVLQMGPGSITGKLWRILLLLFPLVSLSAICGIATYTYTYTPTPNLLMHSLCWRGEHLTAAAA